MILSDNKKLEGVGGGLSSPVKISFSGSAGLMCGEWLSFGAPDLPGDQRLSQQFQACWVSEVQETDLQIFGQPSLTLECEVDRETAQVYCGLCHVLPGGGSRLLTYGLLNLNGLEPTRQLTKGKVYTVKVMLDAIGYTVPAGSCLQLQVSPGSFPTSWPSPTTTTLTIRSGALTLPSSHLHTVDPQIIFAETQPRLGPCKKLQVKREPDFKRNLTYGLSDNIRCLTTKSDDGCKYYPDVDTEIDEVNEDRYSITGDDPTSAVAFSSRSCIITYQARTATPIKTETITTSWMRSDQKHFHLTNTLVTRVDGVDFFSKTWQESVARNGI